VNIPESHLAQEAIAALVDGELAGGPAARAARHLTGCAQCRMAVQAQREAKEALHASSDVAVPGDLLSRLRAIPFAGSVAYARPEYRIGADGAPLLARVAAYVGDSTRTGASPAAALAPTVPATDVTAPVTAGADALTRARQLYLDSRAALRRGDWAAVGRTLEALGSALGAPGGAEARP